MGRGPEDQDRHWYFEKDGARQGPFSSRDIQTLVMDGALRLEDQIINAQTGECQPAADAFAPLGETLHSASPTWQPPPRPAEIRTPPPASRRQAGNQDIDYFALLADSKKKKSESKPQTAIPKLRNTSKDARPSLAMRVSGLWNELNSSQKSWALSAAAIAFVGVGISGLMKSNPGSSNREPAATTSTPPAPAPTAPIKNTPLHHNNTSGMPSASGNAIGHGENPVQRDIGQSGIQASPSSNSSESTAQTATPPPQEAPPTAPAEEPPRHFDPSAFEAVNAPVTPPSLQTPDATENPANAERAPAAPDSPSPNASANPEIQVQTQPTESQQPPATTIPQEQVATP